MVKDKLMDESKRENEYKRMINRWISIKRRMNDWMNECG